MIPATPPRRPRLASRKIWAGAISNDVLIVKPGATVKTHDKEGNAVDDRKDSKAQLWANLGDRLLVIDQIIANDNIAVVEIVRVDEVSWRSAVYGVSLVAGTPPVGKCWVWSLHGLRRARAARSAA